MDLKHQTGKVYIVDDDSAVRQAVGLILSRSGFETIGFSDGTSLMRMMRSESLPHCILLDLQLPSESGLEILRQLRAENRSTPVMMISGKGTISEAVAALKLGADDFIEKPFNGAELTGLVGACIGSRMASTMAQVRLPRDEILTRREREVMEQCLKGATAKETALVLGISHRTVEEHRAALMRKLGARSVTDLVRLVLGSVA